MSLTKSKAGIIIPAYNEEEKIGKTIESIIHFPWISRILVVDDGSADNTAKIARNAGADVFSLSANRGKAYAMQTGYNILTNDILIFLDGDIEEGGEQIERLAEPLWDGTADVVIARFPAASAGGGFGLVKGLAQKGLQILTGQTLSSVLSGQRAFLRSALTPELFKYNGYGIEFGMTVDIIWKGLRIYEVDVSMKHRITGRDIQGFCHRFRQFRDILTVFLNKLFAKIISDNNTLPREQDKA